MSTHIPTILWITLKEDSDAPARGRPAAAAHTASTGGPPGSFGASHSNVVFISDP